MPRKISNNYSDIKDEFKKSTEDRTKIIGNNGLRRMARKYHMDDSLALELRKQYKITGLFPNPYKNQGIAHAFVQSLIDLGVDKKHSFSKVKKKIKDIMTKMEKKNGKNGWEMFTEKGVRNEETGKDVNGRIIQTAELYQRLKGMNPYGLSLGQLHSCIDIFKDRLGLPEFRLTTGFKSIRSVLPMKEV